ncbi:MAG: protein translocase subunit SecF [Sphaerochaetaceae bacterium]
MAKKDIPVIKFRWYSCLLAVVLLVVGLVSFIVFGGFNRGIDFESGLGERIQLAPAGLSVTYGGAESAILSIASSSLTLEVRGEGGVKSYVMDSATYPTAADLATALNKIGKISAIALDGSLKTSTLVSGYGFPATLSGDATVLNFANGGSVSIDQVRSALSSLGNVKIQTVGVASDQVFQIRVGMKDDDTQSSLESAVTACLESTFGAGNVVVLQSDYVGPKFSSSLLRSSVLAILVALALILVYIWFRFRFAYAVSSIIALMHDVFMLLGFISLFRLEFSSTTVAALLTIIGYSLNNTIVIFDRVRENVTLSKDAGLPALIDKSVTQSMSRTLMSSLTTLLAIIPLAVFSSGDIKLFAICMIFGVIVGTFSSNFIAPVFLNWITEGQNKHKVKKEETQKK